MTKYTVVFVLPAFATGQVEIEAASPEDARQKFEGMRFMDLARDHIDDQPFEWDDDKKPEFCDVWPADEEARQRP